MANRKLLYWVLQFSGWGIFVFVNLISAYLQDALVYEIKVNAVVLFISGILCSHLYRAFLRKYRWVELRILPLLLRTLLTAPIVSLVFMLIVGGFSDLFLERMDRIVLFNSFTFWGQVFNFSILFVLWGILYYSFHFIRRFQKAQIKNLELKAANTEIELKSVRNQMNPHFMFNSMNSIRALIDEDPAKAKEAVTLLSGIMRSTLNFGKQHLIPFREELELVRKYLAMEKIRFEERLEVSIDVSPEFLNISFPPFMLQTIVENAIKHGISKRKEGGIIHIKSESQGRKLVLSVTNSGNLGENSPQGIGVKNTQQRLQLLFGESASFNIVELNDEVRVELEIPLTASL